MMQILVGLTNLVPPDKFIWILITVGAVLVLIAAFSLLAYLIKRCRWGWSVLGVVAGVVIGLVIGAVVVARVPLTGQYVLLGVLSGMGTDGLFSLRDGAGPSTAIDRLSGSIASIISSAKEAGLAPPAEAPLRRGIWAGCGCVFLVMLLGMLIPVAE